MSTFTTTIFSDILKNEFNKKLTTEEIKNIFNKIDFLYSNTYKKEKELDTAVLDFGDFLYFNLYSLKEVFKETKIMQRYFKLLKKQEDHFVLVLETLNKKERQEVYSLTNSIIEMKYDRSLNFMLDGEPKEVNLPAEFSDEDTKDRISKMVASYITLLLRKEQCVMSIVISNEPYETIIGILIQDKKWMPVKKEYMQAMHVSALKKAGEKIPGNIKYAEIKKKLK